MAMVKNGFTFTELLIGVAILGIAALAAINMSKEETNGIKKINIMESSSYVTKEILIAMKNKSNCEAILQNKMNKSQLQIFSTDGIILKIGSKINNNFILQDLHMELMNIPNLPPQYTLIAIKYSLSLTSNPAQKSSNSIRFLGQVSSGKVVTCISPEEDGSLLVQQKATQIAKDKICQEDLNGTLDSLGRCNWPTPVTYQYVTIQL